MDIQIFCGLVGIIGVPHRGVVSGAGIGRRRVPFIGTPVPVGVELHGKTLFDALSADACPGLAGGMEAPGILVQHKGNTVCAELVVGAVTETGIEFQLEVFFQVDEDIGHRRAGPALCILGQTEGIGADGRCLIAGPIEGHVAQQIPAVDRYRRQGALPVARVLFVEQSGGLDGPGGHLQIPVAAG